MALLREAEVVYSARRVEGSAQIRSSADVVRFCRDLESATQENFCVLLLNTRHRVLARVLVALGTVDSVVVHPREVFRAAIMAGAVAVVLVHNHPGGDPEPSHDDLHLTSRLVKAGNIVGIKVLDHVVIGDGASVALAELHPGLFIPGVEE